MEAFGKSLLQLDDERQHERDDLLHKLVELDQISLMLDIHKNKLLHLEEKEKHAKSVLATAQKELKDVQFLHEVEAMSCLILVDCSKQLDVSIGAAKKILKRAERTFEAADWQRKLVQKNIPFKQEVAVMRTILSLPNLRPGQESSWIKTFKSHLNIPLAQEESRRMLLFLLCRLGTHQPATNMAYYELRSPSSNLLWYFFDELGKIAEK